MPIVVKDINEIKGYPNVDLSQMGVYIIGSLAVKDISATANTLEDAIDIARNQAYSKAYDLVNFGLGKRYPFVVIQDPMPQNVKPADIKIAKVTQRPSDWEAETLESIINAMGYHKFHGLMDFEGPALVYDITQIPKLEIERFNSKAYSEKVKGRGVGSTADEAIENAQIDAYK